MIIGIDPGLAHCGFAVLEDVVHDLGTWQSDPEATIVARARELRADVLRLAARWDGAFAVEAPTWPRNAGAASKYAIAFGVVVGIAGGLGRDLEVIRTDAWRAALGLPKRPRGDEGKRLRKHDTAAEMARRWPAAVDLLETVPRSKHEHAWDALAIASAALDLRRESNNHLEV